MNLHRIACITALLAASLAFSPWAQAEEAEEPELDFAATQAKAQKGDAHSQYVLGMRYAWYRKAALQGNANAQNNLGWMYYEGLGVHRDYAQALEWYRKAAQQGNATAQHNLGVMYDEGKGVRQNTATAKEWFGQACDNGLQEGCDEYARLNKAGF